MERTKWTNQSTKIISEDLLSEILRLDGYMSINVKFIEEFGLISAVILSSYIEKHNFLRKTQLEYDGWFFITHGSLKEKFKFPIHSVREGKRELMDGNIIHTELKGHPPKEYIKINFDILARCIINSSPKSKDSSTQKVKDRSTQKVKDRRHPPDIRLKPYTQNIFGRAYNSTPVLLKNNNKKSPIKERNEKYFPITKILSKIIQSNKNIKHTPRQLTAWTNDVRRLVEENEIDIERIKNTLHWYSKNIGGEYIPVIESGRSLRDKFQKLESAMERDKGITGKKKIEESNDFINPVWKAN